MIPGSVTGGTFTSVMGSVTSSSGATDCVGAEEGGLADEAAA